MFSSLFWHCTGLCQRIYSHTWGWVSGTSEIYSSETGKSTKHKEPTFQSTSPRWDAPLLSAQSLLMQGRPLSVSWDLRLQEALRSRSRDSHTPDARLYSLAKLQQFSKNACNSKHFSLNRSVFVDLGVTGTFPDSSTPISSVHPKSLDGTTPLTHRYTQDKDSTLEWGYSPKLQQHEWQRRMIRSDLDPAMMFNRSWLTCCTEKG